MDFRQRGWVLWRELPGRPPTWEFGTLERRDGRLAFTAEEEPPGGADQVWMAPGFVDLHSHLAIESDGIADDEQITRNAFEEIRAGVLAIRQPGTPADVPEKALPYGRPIVVDAGMHIALEKRYIRGLSNEVPADEPERVAELLRAEVRRQAARGTGWVKLVGDWIDRSMGDAADLMPLWTGDQLAGAVEEARAAGARVAVHAFSRSAIDDLIDAGVDSIEHGSGMTRQQMQRAARHGIPVIPTVSQVLLFPEFAKAARARYPVYAETMQRMYDRRTEWFAELLESGVDLLPGSDAGGYQAHGSLIEEIQMWVQWGVPTSEAFAAATWKSRDFLGLDSLSEGAPVDVLVFDQDPSTSSQVWSAPKQILANGHPVL